MSDDKEPAADSAAPEADRGAPATDRPRARHFVYLLLGILYLLHNDLWLWDDGRLLAGLPAGLVYHVGFCAAAAGILYLLVTRAWPEHLDEQGEEQP